MLWKDREWKLCVPWPELLCMLLQSPLGLAALPAPVSCGSAVVESFAGGHCSELSRDCSCKPLPAAGYWILPVQQEQLPSRRRHGCKFYSNKTILKTPFKMLARRWV